MHTITYKGNHGVFNGNKNPADRESILIMIAIAFDISLRKQVYYIKFAMIWQTACILTIKEATFVTFDIVSFKMWLIYI